MIDPILKWAGGKRWLVKDQSIFRQQNYDRYIEPFLGGGAVFFSLCPSASILSDLNTDLMQFYRQLRDYPLELHELMASHQEKHSKDYYYSIRSLKEGSDLEKASRFLYLNRTCWNGLYRVNLKGEFNVPIGTKNTVLFENDDFPAAALILSNAELRCGDFEKVIDEAQDGDLLFVDPPYTVQHNFNNFVKYNEKIFSWSDQIRLRNSVRGAASRGATVIVTNADHKLVRDLYADICDYQQLSRYSILSGDAAKRGDTTEALFTANTLCSGWSYGGAGKQTRL